jgi:methylenetetrahydrofolate dehydrogenase (NADP+)/methenyltetrahydrofolate cyclohydrolase
VGPYFVPATPLGGLELLKRYNMAIDGERAVIVGASNLIGKPLSLLLTRNWATVTVCDLHTKPLSEMTQQADILASVTGVAHLISADMVKEGATVLDFGFTEMDGEWVGDVDFENVKEIAGAITPVPGGTGPMTNAMLMRNTMTAAQRQAQLGVKQASRVSTVAVSPTPLGEEVSQASSS